MSSSVNQYMEVIKNIYLSKSIYRGERLKMSASVKSYIKK
jgi:hypothetical protein